MSYTDQLYKLQQFDSKIDATKKRLQEISANLTETESLKLARTNVAKSQTAYKQIKVKVTDLDLEVKSIQQKIKQHENRLYSGKLVNPKEATSLQDDITATKQWLEKREEALLELMIEQEEAEEHLETCKETLTKIKAEWEADQANLLAEQTQQQAIIENTKQARLSVAQFINKNHLSQYETLRQQKWGVGVATVQNGNCLSCGVMLSNRLIQQASNASQLHFCDSCGRIIHLL